MSYYKHPHFVIVRLTGLYAIIIGLHATLVKFFATGVQVQNYLDISLGSIESTFQSWQVSLDVEYCRDNWWTNLLYVNNLHWVDEEGMGCVGQGW